MSTFLDFTQGVSTGRTGKIMSGGQMVDAVTCGVPITTLVNPGNTQTLSFPQWGDIAYRILPTGNCSLSIQNGNTGELQKMTIIVQQPYDGNCEITLPDTINWSNKPFIDSRIGSVSILEIIWDGAQNFYGRLIYG